MRKKWDLEFHEPVHVQDLLNEAARRGLVTLPDTYHLVDDNQYTDSELIDEFGAKSTPKRKKKK